MGISAPVNIASGTAAAGSTTLVLTTTADAPAGGLNLVFAGVNGNVVPTSVTDSAGNTYVGLNQFLTPGGHRAKLFYSAGAAHLVSGGTITVTYSATTSILLASAASVQNCGIEDVQAAGVSGTGTTPSVSTGALGVANELVIGMVMLDAGPSDGFTEATGFTSLTAAINTIPLRWAYQIVSATTSVTYAPVLGTSRPYGADVATFKALVSAGTANGVTAVAGAALTGLVATGVANAITTALAMPIRVNIGAGIANGVAGALGSGSGAITASGAAGGSGAALGVGLSSVPALGGLVAVAGVNPSLTILYAGQQAGIS